MKKKSYPPITRNRFRTRKVRGQSIPLLAFMIFVLFGFVAFSADVGNTYQEQRALVRATNAAAISGMQMYLTPATSDAAVFGAVTRAFEENGITPKPYDTGSFGPRERGVRAIYLDQGGNPLGCDVGQCGTRPGNARYIQVQTRGKVDTYFARIMGINDLPVSSSAYAGSCPPVDGVYPFVVSAGALDTNGEFRNYDGTIILPDVAGQFGQRFKWKRMYFGVGEIAVTPQIGIARWRQSYSPEQIAQMLTIPGNLKLGFEEAPYVQIQGEDNTRSTYPNEPRVLSTDDWMYGFTGDTFQSLMMTSLRDQLDTLIDTRTRMILPIYNATAGNPSDGDNPTYRLSEFGSFYIRGYGADSTGSYIDLVSLGRAVTPRGTPCLAENVVVPPDQRYGVLGPVAIRPAWAERNIIPDEEIKPAGYTIILDISGSMSWSIEGWGTWLYQGGDGRDYQCETYNPAVPMPFFPHANPNLSCEGGPRAPWRHENGRRIFEAREAILDIVEGMIPEDRIRIITFNHNLGPVSGRWFDPADPTLPNHIRTIGQCCTNEAGKSPSYLTSGGTAGADGMWKAFELIRAADFPAEYIPPGGTTKQDNRRVIIYMTDGVSNSMFNSNAQNPFRPECAGLTNQINIAFCNIGFAADGRELPVQSMLRISQEMHRDMYNRGYDDFRFFVLAMGRFDTTGLSDVATSPSDMYDARDVGAIAAFLKRISNEIKYDSCMVREAKPGEEVRSAGGNNVPDGGAAAYFRGLVGAGRYNADAATFGTVYGYAIIRKTDDSVQVFAPVIQNTQNQLHFRIDPNSDDALTPGRYTLQVEVGYRGRDSVTRIYNQFWEDGQRKATTTFTISETRAGGPLGDTVPLPVVTMVLPEETIRGIDAECD